MSGKIGDAWFTKMSERYEPEQGENTGRIKALRLEPKKLEDSRTGYSFGKRKGAALSYVPTQISI